MAKPLKILVTNDDGHDSPFLAPFLDAVAAASWCGELRVVIPAREQSWIGKGMTRFSEVVVTPGKVGNHNILFATGTPADCVTLGVHNLFPDRPDAVLSGINMGVNAGLAFFFSSGTVGGALEGFFSQVRSIALSAEIPPEVFESWRHRNWEELNKHDLDWKRIAEVAVNTAAPFVLSDSWKNVDLYSINFPWSANTHSKTAECYTQPTYYESLFKPQGENKFLHKLKGLVYATKEELNQRGYDEAAGDLTVIHRGEIAITPVSFRGQRGFF